MIYLFGLIFLGLLTLGGFAIGYLIFNNFQPGSAKIQADLTKMKKEIADYADQLVPLHEKEMELLSLNQINQQIRKGIVTTIKGVFTSIYNEPMIAYSYKKYIATNANGILYARTAEDEYTYRIKAKQVKFFINNELVGTLKENGVLYSANNKRLMARINRHKDELWLPIIVGDKEVASVVNPDKAMKTNPRALEFVTNMKEETERVFLSLAILEMVNQDIPEQ